MTSDNFCGNSILWNKYSKKLRHYSYLVKRRDYNRIWNEHSKKKKKKKKSQDKEKGWKGQKKTSSNMIDLTNFTALIY